MELPGRTQALFLTTVPIAILGVISGVAALRQESRTTDRCRNEAPDLATIREGLYSTVKVQAVDLAFK
jgi:hypothetical protein